MYCSLLVFVFCFLVEEVANDGMVILSLRVIYSRGRCWCFCSAAVVTRVLEKNLHLIGGEQIAVSCSQSCLDGMQRVDLCGRYI